MDIQRTPEEHRADMATLPNPEEGNKTIWISHPEGEYPIRWWAWATNLANSTGPISYTRVLANGDILVEFEDAKHANEFISSSGTSGLKIRIAPNKIIFRDFTETAHKTDRLMIKGNHVKPSHHPNLTPSVIRTLALGVAPISKCAYVTPPVTKHPIRPYSEMYVVQFPNEYWARRFRRRYNNTVQENIALQIVYANTKDAFDLPDEFWLGANYTSTDDCPLPVVPTPIVLQPTPTESMEKCTPEVIEDIYLTRELVQSIKELPLSNPYPESICLDQMWTEQDEWDFIENEVFH